MVARAGGSFQNCTTYENPNALIHQRKKRSCDTVKTYDEAGCPQTLANTFTVPEVRIHEKKIDKSQSDFE